MLWKMGSSDGTLYCVMVKMNTQELHIDNILERITAISILIHNR